MAEGLKINIKSSSSTQQNASALERAGANAKYLIIE